MKIQFFKLPSLKEIIASALIAMMLIVGVSPTAIAQSFGPTYTQPAQLRTYRAAFTALTVAASPTDFFTIQTTAGTQVRINTIHCDNISTANASALFSVVKRSALDTVGGTPTTLTNVRLNSNNVASVATVKTYTVNPTLGASIGVVAEGVLVSNTAASASIANPGLTFDFSQASGQWLVINDAATQVAVNGNATSLTSGSSVSCWIEWSEA